MMLNYTLTEQENYAFHEYLKKHVERSKWSSTLHSYAKLKVIQNVLFGTAFLVFVLITRIGKTYDNHISSALTIPIYLLVLFILSAILLRFLKNNTSLHRRRLAGRERRPKYYVIQTAEHEPFFRVNQQTNCLPRTKRLRGTKLQRVEFESQLLILVLDCSEILPVPLRVFETQDDYKAFLEFCALVGTG